MLLCWRKLENSHRVELRQPISLSSALLVCRRRRCHWRNNTCRLELQEGALIAHIEIGEKKHALVCLRVQPLTEPRFIPCHRDYAAAAQHTQYFVRLENIRRCFTQKGGTFVLEEYSKYIARSCGRPSLPQPATICI